MGCSVKKFNLGDNVRWPSQARASVTRKSGKVVAVVPAGDDVKAPFLSLFSSNAKRDSLLEISAKYEVMFDGGLPRKHESYLVRVDHLPRKPALYWPRVSTLELIDER